QGIFAQALAPPVVSPPDASLRLSVMASHRPEELSAAGRTLGHIIRRLIGREAFATRDTLAVRANPRRPEVFDLEADERLAARAPAHPNVNRHAQALQHPHRGPARRAR